MKLHDLKPAPGSRTTKRRVGRGIAAGQGKTAGRGTKGQKSRAGGTIPAWFEGGQTPLHQRIPKLHGFRNPFKVHYEIVNVGDIARLVELGELEGGESPGAKARKKGSAPITVNQEILRAAGLVRRVDRPMKVLGGGELGSPLFVVADAFSDSARAKIEAAGGTVSVLEVPDARRPAIGVETDVAAAEASPATEPVETSSTEDHPEAPREDKPARPARTRRGTAEATESAAAETPGDRDSTETVEEEVEAVAAGEASPEAADASAEGATPKRAPRKPRAAKADADA